MVDFDPVPLLVDELQSRFGHLGLFFCNYLGGDLIGMALDPAVKAPRPLRPQAAMDSMPVLSAEEAADATPGPPASGKRSKGDTGTAAAHVCMSALCVVFILHPF